MFRFLRAAFRASPVIPGLGKIPVNVLLCVGALILGFGNPGFWLLGLALETAYLFLLATHLRFQRVVDAEFLQQTERQSLSEREATLGHLGAEARQKLASIEETCAEVLKHTRESQQETDDVIFEGNREALNKLTGLYVKLLDALPEDFQSTTYSVTDASRASEE
jgi:ElaB/YqjD/DUF883 family membrane-anchored ribosome-binding protein